MKKSKNLLLIFVRNPELGKVKKRLAITIGNKKALEIYKFLLKYTAEITKHMAVDKEVHYSEKIEMDDIWENTVYHKKLQVGEDLGQRMEHAFQQGFEAGYKNIIIIGSDMYDLNQQDLENAFLALKKCLYVIGPATDGGYYLLGMKAMDYSLFKNKTWGSNSVLKETLEEIKNEKTTILETRNDIDIFEDVKNHPKFQQFLNPGSNIHQNSLP